MFQVLKKHKLLDLDKLSEYLDKHMKSKSKLIVDFQNRKSENDRYDSEFDLDDEDEEKRSL
jgi:hypothetical protein